MKLPGNILILAPHPDDETLMAAGIIRRMILDGAKVSVCVVTNGDYMCRDHEKGSRRLLESLDAMRLLGMSEDHLYFLGYPDTGMEPEQSFLHRLYHEKDPARVFSSACSDESYGITGGKPDFRFARDKAHSSYSKAAFLRDLDDLLELTGPKLVITSSRWDTHGDHAGLFFFVRDAILRLAKDKRPAFWESLIHSPAGDDNWPLPDGDFFTMPPGLEENTLLKWGGRVTIPLPEDMLCSAREDSLKYKAILQYRTALNFSDEPEVVRYLLSFAKHEEIFWSVDI